ncbi:MAG: dihydroxyacetone kinase phosphoryl donor subunit DhaM [Corynebacterium sp.]|nr:dihydroxyacetone kinase phosphoryl donor subunit DhaM [Corynebacterium sp.]
MIGIVLVSHSAKLAEGLAELASQMARDVPIIPAGGLDDGGIGTSYDKVEAAVQSILDKGMGVAIYTDLGSATLTVETLLDFMDDEPIRFIEGPFVELAVAGAIAAQGGAELDALPTEDLSSATVVPTETPAQEAGYERRVVLVDPAGLHARPAAAVAECAADAQGTVLINGVEADSAMMLMGMGLKAGEEVCIQGDADDRGVIDAIAELLS